MTRKRELLDGACPSPEWRKRSPSICVFPIGAFEQHSQHLPLASDNIAAQYFAEFVARELDAALLPCQNIATSLEHTGFRGTITLRPETLMQIVRDVADEVETQGFTTMIVINGHGGNFALTPVIRDINRRNRKLKILLVEPSKFCDRGVVDADRTRQMDMHAAEYETSLMLALRPDLVRKERADMKPVVKGFAQPDLTTFGVGCFSPKGACGSPSLGTKEKGGKIVASIKRNIMPHIRRRLAWLKKNRIYSGKVPGKR